MIDTDSSGFSGSQSHSYFIPMVDMLAGVVFILVILLASSVLVTRNDFAKTQKMQAETARIEAQLKAAEKAKRLYLDPRRRAELATRTLLGRLASGLTAQGFEVETSVPDARIRITLAKAFETGGASLSASGTRLAKSLGALLERELPCIAGQRSGLAQCKAYPAVRLETAQVRVEAVPDAKSPPPNSALTDARSLALTSEIVADQPNLMALRSPAGTGLFTYAGEGGSGRGVQPQATIDMTFQMAVPAIPKQYALPRHK